MKDLNEEFFDPKGLFTQEEIDAILEYRKSGKIPPIPFEELDWDSVGGIIDDANTDFDYESALEELEKVFDAKPNTPQGEELEKLYKIISDWEDKNFPID